MFHKTYLHISTIDIRVHSVITLLKQKLHLETMKRFILFVSF